jgi:hypothetical protein
LYYPIIMKKTFLLLILPLAVLLSCSKGKTDSAISTVTQTDLNISDIPPVITNYVSENYPDAAIYQAVVLTNCSAKYVVILSTDEELAFDKNSNCIGDGHAFPGAGDPSDCGHPGHGDPGGHHHGHGHPGNFIPADSLPSAILEYISVNYPEYTAGSGRRDTICPAGSVTSVMIMKEDTIHMKVFFGDGNIFLMTGIRIHYAGIPQLIRDYITANYAGYHVCHGTELLTMADNSIRYAIYLDKEHERTRLVISPDFTVICEQILLHHPC